MNTTEPLPFGLPLEALLWLGLALLLAVAVLAYVLGTRTAPGPAKRSARAVARAVVNEVMATDTGAHVPREPRRGTRVLTPAGHVWTRTAEGWWESEDAPHVVASWPVLAGLGVIPATPAFEVLAGGAS